MSHADLKDELTVSLASNLWTLSLKNQQISKLHVKFNYFSNIKLLLCFNFAFI